MRNIPVDLVTRYEGAGWWTRETLGQVLASGLHAAPDSAFRVYSDVRPWSGTFADVEVVARRLAAGLRARGVGAGDVVAFQLPNWMEAAATFWAAAFLGAALVPIVHFYGRNELTQIFTAAKPRVFITAEGFGGLTYQADLCSDIAIVGVVEARLRWPARRRTHARHGRRRSCGTSADRVHLRHHERAEGRHSQSPQPGLRGASALRPDPLDRRQPADRDTGRPLHRNACRFADPGAHWWGGAPCRQLGSRSGTRVDGTRRPDPRRRPALLRHEPAGSSRLHARASGHGSRPSAWAGRRCRPR